MSKKGEPHLNYMNVLPLSNSILLRGVGTGQAVKNTMLSEKIFELQGGVFTPIVCLKLFNDSRELLFHKELKFDKGIENFTFINEGYTTK